MRVLAIFFNRGYSPTNLSIMGRRKIPESEKHLRGTSRPDRPGSIDSNRLTLVTSVPEPPSYYKKQAAKAWYLVCSELIQSGKLTELGLIQVERYCYCFDLMEEAKEELAKGALITFPNGIRAANPAIKLSIDIQRTMGAFEKSYGLTPLAATSIPVPPPIVAQDDEFDI